MKKSNKIIAMIISVVMVFSLFASTIIVSFADTASEIVSDASDTALYESGSYLRASENCCIAVNHFEKIVTVNEKTEVSAVISSIANESVSVLSNEGFGMATNEFIGTACSVICDGMEYKVVVPADVDGSGKISAADARVALRVSAHLDIVSDIQLLAADMDNDMNVTASDARSILRISATVDKLPEIEFAVAEPTTEEPTTEEPTTEEPTTEEPTTEEPTTEEPTTEEPTTEEPTTEEPTTEEPTTEEPTTEEPTTEEPTTEEPTTEEPTTEEPTTEEPTTEEPTTEEPVADDSVDSELTYPSVIDAFFSGKFYAEMIQDDGSIAKIASDGTKTEISMLMENKELSIFSDGTNAYIKFPYLGKTYYVDMKEFESLGADFDIDTVASSMVLVTVENYGVPVITTETLDGVEYDVYTFTDQNETLMKFYADEKGDIKYILSLDTEGNISSEMRLNTLSATIPSEMLTISDCKAGSIFTLFMALGI